jgi:chemotaxis protein MotB
MLANDNIGSSTANLRNLRGKSVFFTAQQGDLTMMTLDLKRSVLLLLCVASVLLSGCVSKGKYEDLEGQYRQLQGQYTNLEGQYTNLQGQYRQLQQSSAAQASQSSAEIAALKKEAAAEKAQVGRFQEAIMFTVNSDLLFRPGSWEMSPQGKDLIAKLAPKLAPYQQNKLVVNGYTDNAPIGPALKREGVTSNEVLSQKRAEAVMQYLISQGVKPDMISARGFGEAKPVASNNTAKGRAQNRRVEVTLAGQTSS